MDGNAENTTLRHTRQHPVDPSAGPTTSSKAPNRSSNWRSTGPSGGCGSS